MKKLFLVISIVFILLSCNSEINNDLPTTDTSLFITSNMVLFPRGTKVVDIYNTVESLFSENEYHEITDGEWKYIETTTTDGLINQTWESIQFTKIKHTITETRGYLKYSVYLYTDEESIREISFNWNGEWVVVGNTSSQQQIEGDITFKF
jgi:hypothetical protein